MPKSTLDKILGNNQWDTTIQKYSKTKMEHDI
jgi:hypothetical protein